MSNALFERACLLCSADISTRRSHAKFCSTSCSMKHWHAANPGHRRWYMLKTQYGITQDDYLAIFASQNESCAICGTREAHQWDVDHCHASGVVRGILCSPCNKGIGCLRDDPNIVAAAVKYLEGSNG